MTAGVIVADFTPLLLSEPPLKYVSVVLARVCVEPVTVFATAVVAILLVCSPFNVVPID